MWSRRGGRFWHERASITLLALTLGAAPALLSASRAEAIQDATKAAGERVELHVVGDAVSVALTRETASELFRRLDMRVDVFGPGDDALELEGMPLAIARLEFTRDTSNIVVIDGATGQELERRTLRAGESLETQVEALTHVAYLVIEALLEARTQAAKPADPKPPPRSVPPPKAPPPKPARTAAARADQLGFDVGIGFAATSLGSSRALPGAELLGEMRWSLESVGTGAMLALATYGSSALEFGDATALVRPITVRALGTLDIPRGSEFSLVVALGPSFNWLRVVPEHSGETVSTTGAESRFEPMLTGALGLRLRLSNQTFLSALLGADLSLVETRFLAETADGQETVLAPARLRPLLTIAASASLDQPTRFSARPAGTP